MTDRTKWGLLAILVTVWVGLLVMRVFTQEEPQRVPLKYKSGQVLSKAAAKPAAGVPTVAKLSKPRDEEDTFRTPKNIFAPLEHQRQEASAAAQQAKARTRAAKAPGAGDLSGQAGPHAMAVSVPVRPLSPEEIAAQQARQQREMAAQQARQAMAQYRFIGYLTQNGEPRGFLGKGREIYIVRAGDAVEAQIQVAAIDSAALRLRDLASNVESSLPLSREGAQPGGF
jgi:hypothetical protein